MTMCGARNCVIYITSDAIRMITAGPIAPERARIDQRKLAGVSLSCPPFSAWRQERTRSRQRPVVDETSLRCWRWYQLIPRRDQRGSGRGVRLRQVMALFSSVRRRAVRKRRSVVASAGKSPSSGAGLVVRCCCLAALNVRSALCLCSLPLGLPWLGAHFRVEHSPLSFWSWSISAARRRTCFRSAMAVVRKRRSVLPFYPPTLPQ